MAMLGLSMMRAALLVLFVTFNEAADVDLFGGLAKPAEPLAKPRRLRHKEAHHSAHLAHPPKPGAESALASHEAKEHKKPVPKGHHLHLLHHRRHLAHGKLGGEAKKPLVHHGFRPHHAAVAHKKRHVTRRHFHNFLQVEKPKAKEEKNASKLYGPDHDTMTKTTFVNDCAEVFNVTDPQYLPLGALEQFCQSTNNIVECRQQIVTKLQRTQKKGGSMTDFCSETYDWFQGRYGQHCLAQCEKAQCKSTCRWMTDKKQLDAQRGDLELEIAKSGTLKKELDKAQAAIAEAQREVELQQGKVKITEDQVARAEAGKKQAEQALAIIKNEVAPLEAKVASLQEKVDAAQANITAEEGTLKQIQDDIEMQQLKSSMKLNEVKKLEKNIAEGEAALKREKEKVEFINKKIASTKEDVEITDKKLKDVEKESGSQKTAVEKQQDRLKRAEEQYKAGNPGHMDELMARIAMKAQKEHVDNQQVRLQEAIDKFREIERRRQDLQAAVNSGHKTVESLERDITQLRQENAPTRLKLQQWAEDLKKAKEEAEAIAAGVARRQEQAANVTVQIKTLETEKAKATLTLKGAQEAAQEEIGKMRKAQLALDKVTAMHDLNKGELERQRAKLKANTKAVQERAAKGDELKKKWTEQNGALLAKLKATEKKIADLEKQKPAVVRQHNLGLLGSWLGDGQ